MGLASGVHHLAISTADMKAQLTFFCDVLGAELKALYWMHGVEGAQHGFVKLNDSSYVAFVQMPAIAEIETDIGVTHAGSGAGTSAPGTMQHVAFNVDSLDDLLALRDRIRSRGINVFGPLDHGLCHSIYFAGPEHLTLEIATSAAPIDERAWIDPEVVALCGIDGDELAAMRAPADYDDEGGRVPNPPIDWSKPHMVMGERAAYEKLMAMPDELVTARLSQNVPPVQVEEEAEQTEQAALQPTG
jgi:catechol 2,3-dioxygenase-like lactoylglutathione lyase family enzyme